MSVSLLPKRKKPESLEKTPELPGSIGMLHRQMNELFDQASERGADGHHSA